MENYLLCLNWAKVLSIIGVIFLVCAISPTGDFVDPSDWVLKRQIKWMLRFLRERNLGSPVIINPVLLYLGLILSIIGILLS